MTASLDSEENHYEIPNAAIINPLELTQLEILKASALLLFLSIYLKQCTLFFPALLRYK